MPSDWKRVAHEKECGGSEKSMGTKKTLSDCADSCREISSMFIYGTNDFGENKCKLFGAEECPCYCETSAKNGKCKMVDNSGYWLYKYVEVKKGEGTKTSLTQNKCILFIYKFISCFCCVFLKNRIVHYYNNFILHHKLYNCIGKRLSLFE